MNRNTRPAMANTMALRLYLEERVKDASLVKPLIELIARFPDKYADGFYNLVDEDSLDKGLLAERFQRHFDEPIDVQYIGLDDLRQNEDEQFRIYKLLHLHTFRGWIAAKSAASDDDKELLRLVKRSLGTHRIMHVLDRTFGNDFSSIVKNNIIAVWHAYCHAILHLDETGIRKYGDTCELLTKVMPIGIIKPQPKLKPKKGRKQKTAGVPRRSLTVFVERTSASRHIGNEASVSHETARAVRTEAIVAEILRDPVMVREVMRKLSEQASKPA